MNIACEKLGKPRVSLMPLSKSKGIRTTRWGDVMLIVDIPPSSFTGQWVNHFESQPPSISTSRPKAPSCLKHESCRDHQSFPRLKRSTLGFGQKWNQKKCKENQLPVYFGRVLILNQTCFTVVFLAPMSTRSCSKWWSKNGTWFTSNHNCAS